MKKVSADTITDITLKGASGPVPLPPRVKDLINDILKKNPGAEDDIRDFLKAKPAGFRFVPVLYSRVSNVKNEELAEEYGFKVRTDFLSFLATHHADALRRLGICEHGISRMAKGLDATTADDKIYALSIDHIIERSGAGRYAEEKSSDPKRPGVGPRYPVNHFDNLILLPEKVHLYKNRLNTLQHIGDMKPGQNVWMLMLIPEVRGPDKGYVCPPQAQGSGYAPEVIELRDERRLSRANFIARQAHEGLWSMHKNPLMANLVATMLEISARQGETPAAIAAREENSRRKPSLRTIFNATVDYDPKSRAHLDRRVRPFVEEARVLLRDSFNKMAADAKANPKKNNLHLFARLYGGSAVSRLRREASKFPLRETVDFLRECERIDRELALLRPARNTFNRAANNNEPQQDKPHQNGPHQNGPHQNGPRQNSPAQDGPAPRRPPGGKGAQAPVKSPAKKSRGNRR